LTPPRVVFTFPRLCTDRVRPDRVAGSFAPTRWALPGTYQVIQEGHQDMLDATQLIMDLQDMRDSGHLSDALLRQAVKRIAKADARFDWVGVYLLDDEKQELWLHNYVGAPTEHAKIPVGTGVCGAAVAEGRNLNVPDVTEFDDYLACDPDVQSEMVVLIRAGDEIFGQLDVDSNEKGAFTDEDEQAFETVAAKLAEQLAAERR
jgi:GAF domain-containing protein